MKNKTNIKYLGWSIAGSTAIGCVLAWCTNYNLSGKFFIDSIIYSATILALPALYISCMVIVSVDDVRDSLKKVNDYTAVLSNFDNTARSDFYNNYSNSSNGFLAEYKQLINDIDLVLKEQAGENLEEIHKRMKSSSVDCRTFIEQFKYVDVYLENIQYKKNNVILEVDNDDNTKGKYYITFTNEQKKKLLALLLKIVDKNILANKDELTELKSLLGNYKFVCDNLYSQLVSSLSKFTGNSSNKKDEEDRIDE